MTSKFEQLIEFVINDEEAKAKELFHDIVVEKSREIYESLMEEEDAEDTQEVDEGVENDGDAADDLITDVETEEEGMNEEDDMDAEFDDEAEEAGDDLTHDIEGAGDGEGDIEDRVVDLEDKLDELMAEFEAMMGGEGGEEEQEFDMDAGGDAIEISPHHASFWKGLGWKIIGPERWCKRVNSASILMSESCEDFADYTKLDSQKLAPGTAWKFVTILTSHCTHSINRR